jgi:hypothetical protein
VPRSTPPLARRPCTSTLTRALSRLQVIYLDADTLPLRNIDHLFAEPLGDEPGGGGRALAAAPEINPPALFNSGVMLLAPSQPLFARMLAAAALVPAYDKTDQGFLNEFFSGQARPRPPRTRRGCVRAARGRAVPRHTPRCAPPWHEAIRARLSPPRRAR